MVWNIRKHFFSVMLSSVLAASTVSADEQIANMQFVATSDIETTDGRYVPPGTVVTAIGVMEVSDLISPSGKIFTFFLDDDIVIADFQAFEKLNDLENNAYSDDITTSSKESAASICVALVETNSTQYALPLTTADLENYVRVKAGGSNIESFSIEKPTAETDRGMIIGRDTSRLCINGLAHSTTYEITILAGMNISDKANFLGSVAASSAQSKGNGNPERLEHNILVYKKTPPKKPSIRVNQAYSILTPKSDALIPITITNIKEINLKIMKIDLRSVSNVSGLFKGTGLDYYNGQIVGERSFSINHVSDEATEINLNVNSIFEGAGEGLYAIEFSSPELGGYYGDTPLVQWVMRSNIGISQYSGVSQSQIFLTRFDDTAPVTNAKVQIIARNNRVLFEGISNDQGMIQVSNDFLNGSSGNAPDLLIVTGQDSETSILRLPELGTHPKFLSSGQEKKHEEDVYITSDRETYRAGDTIHLTGIMRNLKLEPLQNFDVLISLINPKGNTQQTLTARSNDVGFFELDILTEAASLLGGYKIKASKIDKTVLSEYEIKIEDFVPLTVETNLSLNGDIWNLNQQESFKVAAEYLSGGVAGGLSAEIFGRVKAVRNHENPQLDGFIFGQDNSTSFVHAINTEQFQLNNEGFFDGKIDTSNFDLNVNSLFEVELIANVFDVGGRPNFAKNTIQLKTAEAYVGIKPITQGVVETGSEVSFEIANVDRQGHDVIGPNLIYTLRKVRRSYDYYYDDDYYGWRYRGTRLGTELIEQGEISAARFSLKNRLSWGSYELIVKNGAGFETIYSFSAGWNGEPKPTAEPEQLDIFVERSDPKTGTLKVDAPFSGKLRILTASSDILSVVEMNVEQGDQQIDIALPVSVEPGFHILATLIRPVEKGTEHMAQFALGKFWLENLKEGRTISAEIQSNDTVRSFEEIEVTISTEVKQGTAKLYLVDEGIHLLTKFKNADPTSYFYDERQLSLGIASNFGQLIKQDLSLDAYNVGGDEELLRSGDTPEKSEFFKTVTEASPALDLINGTVSYKFDATEFEGKLRLVVLVVSAEGVGISEKNITVQDPLSMDISLPRFVGKGDRISAKIALRANEDVGKVDFEKQFGENIETLSLEINKEQSLVASLLMAPDEVGRIPVSLSSSYGQIKIDRHFEIVSRLTSYPHSEMKTALLTPEKFFSSGQKLQSVNFDEFDVQNQKDLAFSATVGFTPGVDMSQILGSLDRYPYGCIEQTSSATRGLIYRAKILGKSADTIKKINVGLTKIIAKQKTNGSFGYWDNQGEVYDEYQPYAVETLIMGLEYAQNPTRVKAAIKKGLDRLYASHFSDLENSLYSYGILAKAQYEVTSRARYSIDRLMEANFTKKDDVNLLSLAYWLAAKLNDDERLKSLDERIGVTISTNRSNSLFKDKMDGNDWYKPSEYLDLSRSFSSSYALDYGYFLADVKPEQSTPNTSAILETTRAYMSTRSYRSTYFNAKLAAIFAARESQSKDLKIKIDGVGVIPDEAGKISLSSEQVSRGFKVWHNSKIPVFVTVEAVGNRHTVTKIDNGLVIDKVWYNESGEYVAFDGNTLHAKQGDLFTVTLRIWPSKTNDSNSDVMITDLLPSGFEIENVELQRPIENSREATFTESMDDRFVAHFDYISNKPTIYSYTVRAVYAGEMILPDAHAEMMYKPEINGRSPVLKAIIEPR